MGESIRPGAKRPPGADPPRWLLALGCAALGLLLGGVLLGGEGGARLVALACIAFPTLVSAFLALLARRYLRPPDTR
jgi:hypothetical protein